MKINMPSLKVDMVLSEVRLRDGVPVIVCRMGVYEATVELAKADIGSFIRQLLRPRVLWAFAKLTFSRKQA